jgi:hypothetical protein
VVDGEDEGQADLDVVPRGAALDGGGGVDEYPWDGDSDRDSFPGEREGEDEEGAVEAEVSAKAGGEGVRDGGAGQEVEAEEWKVAQGFPRVPPLRVVAGSEGGGGGHD